jgi:hypothetical protein
MTIETLQAQLDALDEPALGEPGNFQRRADALDTLAREIIDEIDALLAYPAQPRKLRALRQAAVQLQQRLLATDELVYQDLRARIRVGYRGAPLRQTLEQLAGMPAASAQGRAMFGYDRLDRLVGGILDSDTIPEPRRAPEAGMILNQRTPARLVFELLHRAELGAEDCFFDIGAGTGHVATLVHLLSGAAARGVEFEPAFCEYAQARAAALNLTDIAFLNADARHADYAAGTIFYLFTPFEGAMLHEVLDRLRERARSGPIRLATYGACTGVVAQQEWVSAPSPAEPGSYRLALFSSLSE